MKFSLQAGGILLISLLVFLSDCSLFAQEKSVATSNLVFECRPIPPFDPLHWKSVEMIFEALPAIPLQQNWLPAPESQFEPATVRVGWQPDSVWIYAVMEDRDIFNPTTRMNQLQDPNEKIPGKDYDVVTAVMGDVLEVLVRGANSGPYYELHVTPQNQALQLKWMDWKDYATMEETPEAKNPFVSHLVNGERLFTSYVQVDKAHKQWRVLMQIPARLINGTDTISIGQDWLISCSRYDWDQDVARPGLSSTSVHQKYRGHSISFHRQEEWGRLKFVD
ncbi:MAG: hypothetical protein ABI615_01200 [Chthoniobacterales bacterium]